MKQQKKLAIVLVVVVLLVALTTGVTLSYYPPTASVASVQTVGEVAISLNKDAWIMGTELAFEQKLVQNIEVQVAPESQPCYLRVQMELDDTLRRILWVPGADGEAPALNPLFRYEGQSEDGKHNFVCTRIAAPGETLLVFDTVAVRPATAGITASDLKAADGQNIHFWAQAVQAQGFDGYEQAFGLFDQSAPAA